MDLKDFVPIKGFEETHLVNKYTQEVYSMIKKKILKGSMCGGYKRYSIIDKNGKVIMKPLHKIMAETFIPNPNNFPVVNHIDGNKLNNDISNLEWCTISHNNKEAYRLGLRKVSQKTKEQFMRDCHTPEIMEKAIQNLKDSREKAIRNSRLANMRKICIFKDGFYQEFESETEASEYLKVHKGSVGRVARNPDFTIKGYKAKYI